jgi:hypothetical protein
MTIILHKFRAANWTQAAIWLAEHVPAKGDIAAWLTR